MPRRAAAAVTYAATSLPIEALRGSFELSLRAERKSDRTIKTYLEAFDSLDSFLRASGMPRNAGAVRREHVEAFLVDLANRRRKDGALFSPATVSNRYRGLQSFWNWAVRQDEIDVSPMKNMSPPKVPDKPVPLLSVEQLKRLLKVCEGKEPTQRRDMAIIRLFIDTPLRRDELASLTLEDVFLQTQTLVVRHGKGDKGRTVSFGARTATALDRYLRARAAHRHADVQLRGSRAEPLGRALWLGPRGVLTANGIYQMIQSRGEEAGLGRIHPHQFRHTFSHEWLADGGSEGDLMAMAGWSSRQMLKRYGSAAANERAITAYQRRGFGDRV